MSIHMFLAILQKKRACSLSLAMCILEGFDCTFVCFFKNKLWLLVVVIFFWSSTSGHSIIMGYFWENAELPFPTSPFVSILHLLFGCAGTDSTNHAGQWFYKGTLQLLYLCGWAGKWFYMDYVADNTNSNPLCPVLSMEGQKLLACLSMMGSIWLNLVRSKCVTNGPD